MGAGSVAVMGLGSLLITLSFNLIIGWNLDANCPGTAEFCAGVWWSAVVGYVPVWLFIAQALVVLALGSPYALARTGR